MNRILVLGMYRFPHGDAPSNRILALAKTLKEAGFDPFVIGNGVHSEAYRDPIDGSYAVDGIRFTSVRDPADRLAYRIRARLLQTWVLARAARRAGVRDVRCVYMTHGTVTLGLKLLCRYVWRLPIIIDCTEWHEPSQFRRGRLSPAYLSFAYKFHVLCGKANIIGITTTICDEFERRGCQVFRVPPQVDVATFDPHDRATAADPVELFYAGTAAGKDRVATAIEGLLILSPAERARIRFTIAGPTSAELASALAGGEADLAELGGCLRILGRIPRQDVLRHLGRSNFTVLLRPVSRYSSAGFPSKVPESLAAGTPPMLNLTSDLGRYITDGEDALVVDDCSPGAFAAAVRRALALPTSELDRLSANARRCACDHFDYRVWAGPMRAFVESAV